MAGRKVDRMADRREPLKVASKVLRMAVSLDRKKAEMKAD
jgi:hypothetical protein